MQKISELTWGLQTIIKDIAHDDEFGLNKVGGETFKKVANGNFSAILTRPVSVYPPQGIKVTRAIWFQLDYLTFTLTFWVLLTQSLF